ncbi:hypothetical protein [Dyella mobilis]|uniref:DUF2721 domain-containing protein n=1 Tax=Dyella mobilis TaxID=1849582 RepID=A0ABS2KC19_9GAMM|nr:hypothetical protein [Dyella mobilis]MBM7128717.1 hypothetical protein [Dyella mobilis]GLQ99043.1 hypothetical protein GCM10007863_34630 [Dyella mobilis]
MQLLTKDNIVFVLAIIAAIPVFKIGVLSLAAWNQQWSVKLLEKEMVLTHRLHDDPRAYYTFIAKYMFMVFALLGINLMFSAIGITDFAQKLYGVERFVSGCTAYFLAVFALGTVVRVEQADETIARIEARLRKLRGGDFEPRS